MPYGAASLSRLMLAAALIALAAGAANAQPRHMEASGGNLAIDSPCARAVTIQPDANLTGRVVVDATADHPEEITQLVLESGGTARLHGPQRQCWAPADASSFERTLSLAVRVPAGMAIAIEESGGARYALGNIGGALTLDVSGGTDLRAEHVTALALTLSGGGTVKIAQVDGSIKADISGAGDIQVDHGTVPDLDLSLSGGGGFTLASGKVGRMSAELSGSGKARLGGTVGDVTVSISGTGSVRLAKLTGSLTKDVSGSGEVIVGAP